MPNIFAPLGFAARRFNKQPLLGIDAVTQMLGGYADAEGVGASRHAGFGGEMDSDPITRSLMLQTLAGGKPVDEIARTPQQGLLSYGLSKLGVLSPMIHATADQQAMEQLALRGQSRQCAGEIGDIFSTAANIAKISPELAKQLFEASTAADPNLGEFARSIPSDTWSKIYTTGDKQQQYMQYLQQRDLASQHERAAKDEVEAAHWRAEGAHWDQMAAQTAAYHGMEQQHWEESNKRLKEQNDYDEAVKILTSANATPEQKAGAQEVVNRHLNIKPSTVLTGASSGGGGGILEWLGLTTPSAGAAAGGPAPAPVVPW